MSNTLKSAAVSAYEYLDDIGEQTFFIGGHPAIERLNRVKQALRESLADDSRYTPCDCLSPERCNVYDRCCKND